MSQQPQDPDELQTPPTLAQIASGLVSFGSGVGIAVGTSFVIPENFSIIILIAFFMTALAVYYLTLSCLSRLLTGSWDEYSKKQKNVDMSD